MTQDDIKLWIAMADDMGDAHDGDMGRFALMRDRQVHDLAALVNRMALQLRPTNELRSAAIDYLKRQNLTGIALRAVQEPRHE